MSIETRWVDCEACHGEGRIERRHPRWGCADCPEPWIDVTCPECDGCGLMLVEVEPVTLEDLEERDKQEIAASVR